MKKSGLAVEVTCRPLTVKLPAGTALACYRIAQEALKNIAEHARARTVHILLERRGASAILTVRDDGIGFSPAKRKAGTGKIHGFGLLSMSERASCVGGQFSVVSEPGKGTTIQVRVPVRAGSDRLPSPVNRLPVPSLS